MNSWCLLHARARVLLFLGLTFHHLIEQIRSVLDSFMFRKPHATPRALWAALLARALAARFATTAR